MRSGADHKRGEIHTVASLGWMLRFLHDPIACFAGIQRRYGCLVPFGIPFWSAGRRFIIAIGGRYNREVLGQPDLYRPGGQVLTGPRGSAHYRLRDGLLAMYGERHRLHRRLMLPVFSKPAITAGAGVMAKLIDDVIDGWRPGEPFDMYRQMRTLSNWVAAYMLFGNRDFDRSIKIGREIEKWVEYDVRARRLLSVVDLPGTPCRQVVRQAERLERLMIETVEQNRAATPPGDDVLSTLIHSPAFGSGLTKQDLVAHAAILYLASFETTANALSWTLFLIAQHPAIAADLHDEVSGLGGGWPPDTQALDNLPLLNGVVLESLRLMPPVAYTIRTARRAATLLDFPIRNGDKMVLCHFLTHRLPEVFPNPNRFDPTRWLGARPDPYDYVPFSAGPRLCLGYTFALLELKLTVARVMQRFRASVVPNSTIDGAVRLTLRPRLGIPMIVNPQDRAFAAVPVKGNIHGMVDMAA